MSSDLTSLVYRIHPPYLTSDEKLTMLALADYAGATGKIFPSYDHLCLKTCIKRRTQINVVKTLVSKGFLAKVHQFKTVNGKTYNTSNAYCLNYELLIKLAAPIKRPTEAPAGFNFAEHTDDANTALPPHSDINPPVQMLHPVSANAAPTLCSPCTQNSSLNSSLKELASGKKELAEKALSALREGAARKEARMAPKEEVNEQAAPKTEPTESLTPSLIKAGIRESKIPSILRDYPEAQINQALGKLATKQGVKNAEAFFMTLVKEPVEVSKAEQDRAARIHQEAVEEQKRKEAWEAGDRARQANLDNPEKTRSHIEEMRLAIKTARRAAC